MEPSGAEWMASGGSFLLLGIVWFGSSVFYATLGLKAGKRLGSPNDGCLFAIANSIMAFVGAAAGYLPFMTHFPLFVGTSIAGALILPALSTLYFVRTFRR
ncbi:hypothetical protein BH11ARM1_BH11ARM1_07540 [soil metagenome]